jgi:two-component system, NarL family, sensor histidine kinase DesK
VTIFSVRRVIPKFANASIPSSSAQELRWPTAFALVIFFLVLGTRALDLLALSGPVTTDDLYQVGFDVALFVVPVLLVFADFRQVLLRYRWQVLAWQSALTWIPFALFGAKWQVGVAGLLGGLVLLCFSGWLSWAAAVGILGCDVIFRAAVTGLPWGPAWSGALWATIAFIDSASVIFGIIRLVQVTGELQQARSQALEMGAVSERLHAAEALDSGVDARVRDVATKVAAADRLYSNDPARASALIKSAGEVARKAAARAREVLAERGSLESPPDVRVPKGESMLGTRLAWGVLTVILCGYLTAGINDEYAFFRHPSARLIAVLIAFSALYLALQLYHSRVALQQNRGSLWPLTLFAQTAITYAFFLPPVGLLFTAPGFLAGSMLLLLPRRVRWAAFMAILASWCALYALVPLHYETRADTSGLITFYEGWGLLFTALLVYGLSRLVDIARQLETVRSRLARAAGVAERLRVARDVHDFLGLGLSALALKADLVNQLIDRHDPLAPSEIQLMSRICASSRADIRRVTAGQQNFTLEEEVAAASEILSSAGIDLRVTGANEHFGAGIEDVLVPVLRESVTNILRHSSATICSIDINGQVDTIQLVVSNNGVDGMDAAVGGGWDGDRPRTPTGTGQGLTNLASRIEAVGGDLGTRRTNDGFELTATVPLSLSEVAPGS